nr:O-antigen ligase family protein [Marivibrio halodurans]
MGADLLNYKVGGTCIAGLALILLAQEIDDGKHGRALAGAALVGLLVAATQSTTALAAYGIGVAAFLAAVALPRVIGPAVAVAIPCVVMAMPWLPDPPFSLMKELSASGLHRAAIWHFTIDRIHEAQFLGWGLDSARDLPGGRDLVPDNFFGYKVQWVPEWHQLMQLETAEILPLHPHNNSLQVWLELGFPGAVLFAALYGGAAILINRDSGRSRVQKAGLLAILCYLFVVASASFGIWQSWWICLQLTVWTLALAVLTKPHPVRPMPGQMPDIAGT